MAPTIHRHGIPAFETVLIEGKATRLNPLVSHADNEDCYVCQIAGHVALLV